MFIGAGTIVVVYILTGLYMMTICRDESTFSNPLWYGLVVIFWPIPVVGGLGWLMSQWIKSIIKYYKKKGEKK